MKRTICKEVKYSAEEWKTICALAAKCGKCPAAYIREKALNGKIRVCDVLNCISDFNRKSERFIIEINNIAKTVNTEKCIYKKDVEDVKKAIDGLEELIHIHLPTLVFKEL